MFISTMLPHVQLLLTQRRNPNRQEKREELERERERGREKERERERECVREKKKERRKEKRNGVHYNPREMTSHSAWHNPTNHLRPSSLALALLLRATPNVLSTNDIQQTT